MDVVASWDGGKADVLREAFRMTNEAFAAHLGVAVRTVAYWRQRSDVVPQSAMQEILDAALAGAPEAVQARFDLLLSDTQRRAANSSPHRSIGEDIANLTTWITAADTANDVIGQIAQGAASLAGRHTQLPARRVLSDVLRLQRQTQTLLQSGQPRPRQTRELCRVNSDLLAHAGLLFGDLSRDQAAVKYGAAALLYAQEAEANQAVALTVQAKTARWQERFVESADLARRGYECSALTPIRVQLAYQEANAAALLGDASRAREALKRGEHAAETLAVSDSGISAWSFPLERQAIFALSVAIHTGDPDGALRAASLADAGWASGDPQVPATWAQIRAGSAIAYLMKDDLEGAAAQVTPMLTLAPELRLATVTGYLKNLDRRLNQARFHSSKAAIGLRRQVREFNSVALREQYNVES
jgi:hypothetical protein